MGTGVLVIAEQRDGEFRKVTYEAVSEGRRVADALGADVTAVVLGSGVEGIAGDLGQYGADKVLVADNEALAEYLTDIYVNVTAEVIEKQAAQIVVLGASTQGKDLAARLAARLNAALAMDYYPTVFYRLPAHKVPDICIETSVFFSHSQKSLTVLNRRIYLEFVPNDSFIGEQVLDLFDIVRSYLFRIKMVKCLSVFCSLLQDG